MINGVRHGEKLTKQRVSGQWCQTWRETDEARVSGQWCQTWRETDETRVSGQWCQTWRETDEAESEWSKVSDMERN